MHLLRPLLVAWLAVATFALSIPHYDMQQLYPRSDRAPPTINFAESVPEDRRAALAADVLATYGKDRTIQSFKVYQDYRDRRGTQSAVVNLYRKGQRAKRAHMEKPAASTQRSPQQDPPSSGLDPSTQAPEASSSNLHPGGSGPPSSDPNVPAGSKPRPISDPPPRRRYPPLPPKVTEPRRLSTGG